MSLSEMSSSELLAYLRKKQVARSWTLAEFVEAERRGKNFLDADPELAIAFWAERDRLLAPAAAALRAAYEPSREALARLAGRIDSIELPEMTRLSDLPSINEIRHDEMIAVLERTDSRLAKIENHSRRDWVFWVQFAAVLAGVFLASISVL